MANIPRKSGVAARPVYRRIFILEWIEAVGTTQREVAEKAGVSESHLSLLANGKRPYGQPMLERIAEALGPHIEARMLLYPPPEPAVWGMWSELNPAQRKKAADMIEILKRDE